jgi:hypothetical protein
MVYPIDQFSVADAMLFLCDFHREQSWERWCNKGANGVMDRQSEVLMYLRNIADATTLTDLDLAITQFRQSDVYKTVAKLQRYFEKEWFPIIQV